MNIKIHHFIPGRIRIHYNLSEVSNKQALLAQTLIAVQAGIQDIFLNSNLGSFLIIYDTNILSQNEIINLFKALSDKYLCDNELLKNVQDIPEQQSIVGVMIETLFFHYVKKLLPSPLRMFFLIKEILPRIFTAFTCVAKGKLFSVELLDATALTVSCCTGKKNTASSISMLLKMGEEIEEITKRKSYENLTSTLLAINNEVQLVELDKNNNIIEEKTVNLHSIKKGDLIIVRENSIIPVDGVVEKGLALVNEASITGESIPKEKALGTMVFAGTLLQEGEIYVKVISALQNTKVQNIISLIENSQNLKATSQKKSEQFAQKIVPFNFLVTFLTFLFTRNISKTISTLLVDYSCALKLAAPIAVLSAMKEAANYGISVKGGIYLEEASKADVIVFDKTGTLTNAKPTVQKIFASKGFTQNEVLTLAACLEEHFPHPLGKAVVKEAEKHNLIHPENHAKVEYIVAHGIASFYKGKKIAIGSSHFIFEDEKTPLTAEAIELKQKAEMLASSLLFLAYDNTLAGIIALGDSVKTEANEIIKSLYKSGIKKCIIISGDSECSVKKTANICGIKNYFAEALPEDKVKIISKEKNEGHKVIMVGDGINDAPSLSCADVGIAIDGCSSIASSTSDVEFSKEGLKNLLVLRKIGKELQNRIEMNNAMILGINSFLLFGGIFGFISPSLAAVLHNSSTIAICMHSMKPFLIEK